MKISVTDKFLWDVYSFLESANSAANFMFKAPTMRNWLPGEKNPVFEKYRKEKGRREFSNLIYYLKRKGYIKAKNLEGKQGMLLTKQGIDKAFTTSFKLGKGKKRKDGKWAMLIFDMPKRRRKERDLLRSVLCNLGYKMFQQSVWMTPYDVSDKTEKLLQRYSLDKYVRIFIIEEL
ncbi:MAG: CRISPR-associated endonuclease Cas2 [Candidatus Staskawiczbacteria bacterium]|nr:CRISPR-associated endonuclease Cas2 [Candidatus Staskawiczbacteria bacterium]